jgi:hypothetical protein
VLPSCFGLWTTNRAIQEFENLRPALAATSTSHVLRDEISSLGKLTKVIIPNEIVINGNTTLGPSLFTAMVAGSWKTTLDTV